MTPTHIILSGPDGKRTEMTIEEARRLWRELGAALGMSQTQPITVQPPDWMKILPEPQPEPYWPPLRPYWVSPGTGDPIPPPYVVTCEVRQ